MVSADGTKGHDAMARHIKDVLAENKKYGSVKNRSKLYMLVYPHFITKVNVTSIN